MFATLSLAERIELAEARLTRTLGETLRQRSPDTLVVPIGQGIGVSTAEPSPFEKVIGVGFGNDDLAALLSFEETVLQRNRTVRVELSTLADPSLGKALTLRHYAFEGCENVLGLDLAHWKIQKQEFDVHEVAHNQLEIWIEALVDGFAQPESEHDAGAGTAEAFDRESLSQCLRDLATTPDYKLFLAKRDGAIAGGASMRIDGDIAQLTGAATLLHHRRRGVQTALLHERLRHAKASGCSHAVVTTQPGSKSQENVTRQGFGLLYVRNVLVKR